MVRKCIICGASQSKQNSTLSFHRFPRDEILRDKWLKACHLNEDTLKLDTIICSKHFRQEDYDSSVWPTVRLSPNAVPYPSNIYRTGQNTLPSLTPVINELEPSTSTASGYLSSASNNLSINMKNISVPTSVSESVQIMVVPTTVIEDIEQTPPKTTRKQHLEFVKDGIQRYEKKIKVLTIQKKRLEDRIKSLKNVLSHLYEQL